MVAGRDRIAVLVELEEAGRIGQVDQRIVVELVQVAVDEIGVRAIDQRRIVVGVDDRDGLPVAIPNDRVKLDLVDSECRSNLRGSQPDRPRRTERGDLN